ncbi:MAG: lamin tail domain-containing protein [Gemmataceae bacterium]|nr:lamin tail domain-containing protein [Gemmataceae bacterium]
MRTTIRGLTVAAVLGLAGAAGADDPKDRGPKADPKGTPLELTITGKKTTYPLDLGGLTADGYKKMVGAAGKAGKMPNPPEVDLAVEIKNTSDQPVTVWVKGDPFDLSLGLKGKGAVNAAPPLASTLEFRIPEGVELAPGKTHSIPVKNLMSGFRGRSKYAYWTTAGEYELVATLKTGMSPAPKGAKDAGEGFGEVKLTSAPFKLTVEDKK